jgi:hypothetical protein
MKPEIFAEQLEDLMNRALAETPPVPRMIYELEMAKQRMVRLQLAIEQRAELASQVNQIIPATKLPGN